MNKIDIIDLKFLQMRIDCVNCTNKTSALVLPRCTRFPFNCDKYTDSPLN